jgi:CIC family chloride channel protein
VLRPAIGGLMIGVIALVLPQTMGTGMGYLQDAIDFDPTAHDLMPVIQFCIILFLLKIVTVSLTIGSGGSGGVFGPCMLIGGLLGFTLGLVFYVLQPSLFPGIPLPPLSAFVILGMAAFFAGVANCPLGALVMASEMTSGYALLAPLMLVSVLAMLVSRKDSIYRSQIKDKFHSPAHLGDISFEILSHIRVEDVYRHREVQTVPISADLASLREIISDDRYPFPLIVVDGEGHLAGLLSLGTMREAIFHEELVHLLTARDVMTEIAVTHTDEDLHSVLIRFTEHGYGRMPVVSSAAPDQVLGYLAYQDVMAAYRAEITRLQNTE